MRGGRHPGKPHQNGADAAEKEARHRLRREEEQPAPSACVGSFAACGVAFCSDFHSSVQLVLLPRNIGGFPALESDIHSTCRSVSVSFVRRTYLHRRAARISVQKRCRRRRASYNEPCRKAGADIAGAGLSRTGIRTSGADTCRNCRCCFLCGEKEGRTVGHYRHFCRVGRDILGLPRGRIRHGKGNGEDLRLQPGEK